MALSFCREGRTANYAFLYILIISHLVIKLFIATRFYHLPRRTRAVIDGKNIWLTAVEAFVAASLLAGSVSVANASKAKLYSTH